MSVILIFYLLKSKLKFFGFGNKLKYDDSTTAISNI